MKLGKQVFIFILCAVLLAGFVTPIRAQQATGSYFSQTGHNIIGEFWTFYQSVPDAAVVFGLPITEQFITADGSGLTVQYFEKVRFELRSDQPVGQRVLVSTLGTKLYVAGAPSVNPTSPGACQVINGFGVCYDFLTFFNLYGGTELFGNPISAFEFQPDGRIVQYFERARFEWHPELAEGQNVTLADFGRIYFGKLEDASRMNRAQAFQDDISISPPSVTSIKTMAFAARAVTLPTDAQEIFVVVLNQSLSPVEGATGSVTVHLPTGETLTYPVTTEASGIGIVPVVSFSNQLPGSLVTVNVQMSYNGLSGNTVTSFRIWR